MPSDDVTNGNGEAPASNSIDTLELRLPPKTEYLPVVRATAGVVAGGMSFNYDEVIQVRTAVAEAFELTVRRAVQGAQIPPGLELTIRFTISPETLEVFLPTQLDVAGQRISPEEVESRALLESLVDKLELDADANGVNSIRLVKNRQLSDG